MPESVVTEVLAWLERTRRAPTRRRPRCATRRVTGDPIPLSESATLRCGDAEIVETPLTIPQEFGNLSGILTTPHGGRVSRCASSCSTPGAIRRIGPNRMWVEAARRWAARGVPSLRLDVEAIGEADGAVTPYADDDALYVDALIPQVTGGDRLPGRARRGRPVRHRRAVRRGLLGDVRRARRTRG